MSQYHLQRAGLASLVYVFLNAIAPAAAEVPLTRADVESWRNQVEILLRDGPTRSVRPNDWISVGDAIKTGYSSRADLHFNEGSLARLGELTTFWFESDARNFRVANGTALFFVAGGNGASIIETPNVAAGVQDAAVVVRYVATANNGDEQEEAQFIQDTGRTAVMVLSAGTVEPVEIKLRDGRAVNLSAGQMAIVDNQDLYLFAFDLALFYETSPLVADFALDAMGGEGSDRPTDAVRQALLESMEEQSVFEGDYLLNPRFLNPQNTATTTEGWLYPVGIDEAPNGESGNDTTQLEEDAETTIERPDASEDAIAVPHNASDLEEAELVPTPTAVERSDEPANRDEDNPTADPLPPGLIGPTEEAAPLDQGPENRAEPGRD